MLHTTASIIVEKMDDMEEHMDKHAAHQGLHHIKRGCQVRSGQYHSFCTRKMCLGR
jgi:hypothetical protein